MDISGLDFILINIISYVAGVATGLIICCKNKDKLLIKSRSLDNISNHQYNQPVVASAPIASVPIPSGISPSIVPASIAPQVTKITLE